MSQKVRKTLIMIVMAALIICLMAASLTYTFTYGRYAGGKFDEESPYDDLIEFVGANQYLVYSPEELIQAIKDGYSNIQIADEAEQPFVITEGVTDVTANLVLDVNGKTLIRNSRNPMLDVQTNVSVVLIYDSSDEEQGGFYNPVGSALQASGGTLTVGSGNYDDGPKGTDSASDVSQSTSATLVTRNARTDTSYGTPTKDVTGLPKIDKNHYFAEDYTASTGSFNATYIKPDTFLILTYEDDCMLDESGNLITGVQTEGDAQTGKALTVPCNAASCDFYYYYEVGDNPTTSGETETNTYAVIYGYWDVMALARDDKKNETDEKGMATALKDSGLIWPYASVRMEEGEGFARGGKFSNNFDAVNTYGIYAEGGTLTASGANFTTGGNGVCIRVQSAEAEDKTTGGSLTISGGEFSSEIGNTIEMSGGKMTVTAGKFKKSGGKGIGSGGNDQVANQTAMIDMQGGKLNVSGTKTGDTYSVTMTAGGTDNGDTLENVFGILAHSGGEVSVGGCTFNINGNYSAGVLSYDGTINLNDNTVITVTETHPESQLTSAGVSSERDTSETSSSTGSHPINMNGNVTITSNGLGITARGNINVESGATTVNTPYATGVYVNGGTFKVGSNAQISVKSAVSADYAWGLPPEGTGTSPNIYNGVYVKGGSLKSEGTLNVTFTGVQNAAFNTETQEGKVNTSYLNQQIKSYAVRVDNGNAIIVLGEIKNGVGGGVLVNGGTVELGAVDAENDDLIVSTTGSNYDDQTHYVTGNQWQYDWTLTGGHAVAVEGGTLNIYSGTYTAQMGNGILVRNLASDSTQNTVTVKDGIFEGYNGSGRRVGPGAFYALKVMGGPLTLNINGGTFGKALVNDEVPSTNGGAFVMGNPDAKERATVNVTNASFNSYNSDTFAVFRYVDASFGSSEGTGNVSMTVTKAANEGSDFAAIGVQNDLVYNNDAHSDRGSTITIASGSYTGGFGIWYGSSTDTVNISDGTFTGTARPGLFFAENPGSNVTLSGGLYQGGSGAIDAGDQASPRDIMTGDIIANDAYCFNQYVDGQGDTNKAYAICNREYNWGGAYYDNYHVGGNDRNKNVRLNETTYINGSNGQAFNRRTIIFISNQNGYVSNYTTSIW